MSHVRDRAPRPSQKEGGGDCDEQEENLQNIKRYIVGGKVEDFGTTQASF